MAKNLGAAVLGLLEHERTDLRVAAATVLAAVGGGEPRVVAALTARLGDSDAAVRRIALEGLADMGVTGIAAQLVPLLSDEDPAVAERATQVLAGQGAAAESAIRKQLAAGGSVQVRRLMVGLLLARGTSASIEAVLDQLADPELGEQVLQLLRAELDRGNRTLATKVNKAALARASAAGKRVRTVWARAIRAAEKAAGVAGVVAAGAGRSANGKGTGPRKGPARQAGNGRSRGKVRDAGAGASDGNGRAAALSERAGADAGADADAAIAAPHMDPEVATAVTELGLLLRLIGYQARPSSLPLLIAHTAGDQPRPVRLAAIAAMRRVVAAGEGKTDKAVEKLIDLAGGSDPAVARAAIDTLRGARVPERLAKPFAALIRSHNPAAQKLAMERLPAGGGAAAVKALITALSGTDVAARDAAARGLSRAPEAALPLTRALCAATDPETALRFAAALRPHREHVSPAAVKELSEAARKHLDRRARGKATAESALLERVLLDALADLAPARQVELLFDLARRLRRAGRAGEAFGAVKPLLRSRAELDAAIDDDHRFVLGLLGLLSLGDSILRPTGQDAPVLEQFARLYQHGYPVAGKLAREKDVPDSTLYALGFRLLENHEGAEQELGAELLEGIIDERPRSKLAKNARNKLKLAGYLDG